MFFTCTVVLWTGRVPVRAGISLCVIPLLLLECSGSGEGEDEDECLRASSTLSLLFDSNSRASCSFLLAFFSFLRRFWMEAVETQQGYSRSTLWNRCASACTVATRTSALELGGELPFQTLPHLPLSVQLHLQLPLLRLDLFVLHAGVLHGHLQQALQQTSQLADVFSSQLSMVAGDLTCMLVSRVSTDERPSANRKGAGNPGGRACPSGDSSVIKTSFHLLKAAQITPLSGFYITFSPQHVCVHQRGANFVKCCLLRYKRQRSGYGEINYCNHARHKQRCAR